MRPPYRGAHRRLSRQLREAHMLATDEEAADLERLRVMVSADALCVFTASELLRGVIRGQLDRQVAERGYGPDGLLNAPAAPRQPWETAA